MFKDAVLLIGNLDKKAFLKGKAVSFFLSVQLMLISAVLFQLWYAVHPMFKLEVTDILFMPFVKNAWSSFISDHALIMNNSSRYLHI